MDAGPLKRLAPDSDWFLNLPECPPLPPKLEHSLDANKRHDLVKAPRREDDRLEVPDDEGRGAAAGKSKFFDSYDDGRAAIVNIGGTPKDVAQTKLIRSDYGNVASKFQYLGFGLWENTDPTSAARYRYEPDRTSKREPLTIVTDAEPPTKKVQSVPPPPPRRQKRPPRETPGHRPEEPPAPARPQSLWDEIDGLWQCDVSFREYREDVCVSSTQTTTSPCADLHEPFEKEDTSAMFRRSVLETVTNAPELTLQTYTCSVCHRSIKGRLITAKARKFHPECFVCTYCRKEFKDRTFKADEDGHPYCLTCFEKLLGHFGKAQA